MGQEYWRAQLMGCATVFKPLHRFLSTCIEKHINNSSLISSVYLLSPVQKGGAVPWLVVTAKTWA